MTKNIDQCSYKGCKGITELTVSGHPLCEMHWNDYCDVGHNEGDIIPFIKGELSKKRGLEKWL